MLDAQIWFHSCLILRKARSTEKKTWEGYTQYQRANNRGKIILNEAKIG